MVDGWDLNEDKQQCTQVGDRVFSVDLLEAEIRRESVEEKVYLVVNRNDFQPVSVWLQVRKRYTLECYMVWWCKGEG